LEAWEEGSSGKWARRAEMKVQAAAAPAAAAAARVIGHDVSPSSFWSLRLRRPPARPPACQHGTQPPPRSFIFTQRIFFAVPRAAAWLLAPLTRV